MKGICAMIALVYHLPYRLIPTWEGVVIGTKANVTVLHCSKLR